MRYIELLDGINKDWSVIEKTRYLYQNICKNSTYDERMMYSKDAELLKLIYDREIDIKNDEDTRIVCNTGNKIFLQLLNELGIKAKIIYKESNIDRVIEGNDVALIFWDEEGNKYYTNLIGDMENCRFGLATNYFGTIRNDYEEAQDVSKIPFEELKRIDIKTGYIKKDYNDIVFKLLADEVKNTGNFKKFLTTQGIEVNNLSKEQILENKIQFLTKLIKFRDENAGKSERKQFYKKLFHSSILDKFDSKNFTTFEFAKDVENEVESISVIAINLKGNPTYYVYSEEQQTYICIPLEELKQLTDGYREIHGKSLIVDKDEHESEIG